MVCAHYLHRNIRLSITLLYAIQISVSHILYTYTLLVGLLRIGVLSYSRSRSYKLTYVHIRTDVYSRLLLYLLRGDCAFKMRMWNSCLKDKIAFEYYLIPTPILKYLLVYFVMTHEPIFLLTFTIYYVHMRFIK